MARIHPCLNSEKTGCETLNAVPRKLCPICRRNVTQKKNREKQLNSKSKFYRIPPVSQKKKFKIELSPDVQEQKERTEERKKNRKIELRISKDNTKIGSISKLKKENNRLNGELKKLKNRSLRQILSDTLDGLIRELTNKRDLDWRGYFTCISCGMEFHKSDGENGHYIPRGNILTRWLPLNNNKQCLECNRIKEGNESNYFEGLIKRYGKRAADDLERKRHLMSNMLNHDMTELIDFLKSEIKKLKN